MLARTSLACVALAVVSLFAIPFGCGIDADQITQQLGAPCDATHPCDHDDTCQTATCNAQGFCELTNLTKTPPDPTPFDCKTVSCVDGALVDVSDPTDHQDDGPCVTYACVDGKQVANDKMSGLTCTDFGHQGTCDSKGVCQVPCMMDAQCEQTDLCTVTFCDQSTALCKGEPLDGVLTPGAPQPMGDCHDRTCVMGVDSQVLDTSDKPAADGPCNVPSCSATGTPTQTPKPTGMSCPRPGMSDGVCDSLGECVECVDASDCPTAPACHKATCSTAHKCGVAVSSTPPPNMVPCQVNKCTNGVLSTSASPDGTSCGNNGATCKGGSCGCMSRADCPTGANNGNWVCSGTPGVCSCQDSMCGDSCNPTENTGCGTTRDCTDHAKDGTETGTDCGGGGACPTCGFGGGCTAGSDCASGNCVDNVCCNEPSSTCNGCRRCSALAKGQGADGTCDFVVAGGAGSSCNTVGGACGMTGKCDGAGSCSFVTDGTSCGTSCASGILSQLQCQTQVGPPTAHVCGVASTMPCQGGLLCADMTSCSASCASGGCSAGFTCVNGNTCLKSQGQGCSANTDCASMVCAQNFCCNMACGTPPCGACDGSTGGAVGTCTDAAAGAQPSGCNGTKACDGHGACLVANGDACTTGAQCDTGICSSDGFCCPTACGACHTCSSGTCVNASAGTQANVCDSGHGCAAAGGAGCTCDSSGDCLEQNGGTCSMPSVCSSGHCTDMTCCALGGCTKCQTCATANGTCGPVMSGQPDPGQCTSGNDCGAPGGTVCACDGSSSCKRASGQPCGGGGGSDCVSGTCTSGTCT